MQAPYRWHLARQNLGVTLDVGCGLGRHLQHLAPGSVGVDHNESSVAVARARGLCALTVSDFLASAVAKEGHFEALLVAHVLEHMSASEGVQLLRDYVRFVKPGGKVLLITPQEAGFRSDATHVYWVDDRVLSQLADAVGLEPGPVRSFPFPRSVGKVFRHNEFVCVHTVPSR